MKTLNLKYGQMVPGVEISADFQCKTAIRHTACHKIKTENKIETNCTNFQINESNERKNKLIQSYLSKREVVVGVDF